MKVGNPEQSSSIKLMEGVYLREYTIVNVEDYSNVPNKPTRTVGQNGFEPEICLKLYLQNDDMEKPIEKLLFGKYKRDKISGEIKNWDSFGNQVQWLLYRMFGDFDINNDFSIPIQLLMKLNGKVVKSVSYVIGYDKELQKLKYDTYNKFFTKNDTTETILAQFNKDLPYLRKYNPSALAEYAEQTEKFNPTDFQAISNSDVF